MRFVFTSFLIFNIFLINAQTANNCGDAQPFCSDSPETFPGGVNSGSAQPGPSYGCLFSQPNPAWYYLQIGEAGTIQITLTPNPLVDIDFIIWGPFSDPTSPCNGQLTAPNIVDCSFSAQAVEVVDIPNAQVGEFYILLITNFSNNPTNINVTQTGGTGSTDCSVLIPCDLEVDAGESQSVCLGDSFEMNGSFENAEGNTTYEWTSFPENAINDLSETDILNPIFTPSENYGEVTFTLTVTDDGATAGPCSISNEVTFTFRPIPTIDSEPKVCPEGDHTYTINGTPGDSFDYTINGESGTITIGEDSTVTIIVEEVTDELTFIITDGSLGNCPLDSIDLASIDTVFTDVYPISLDTLIQFPADCGIPNGAVSGSGSGFTGVPNFTWTGPGPDSENSINASVWADLPSGWYYFTISDNFCTVSDSIFLEQDPPPTASFDADPIQGNNPLDVTFTNTSDPAETYIWDFGNGSGNTVNDLSSQNTTYLEPGVYTVTLELFDGECSDMATQNIIVVEELPLEYDMPNVFTPNGDGVNDVFTINPVNAVRLEMVITNRWGNIVFQSDNIEEGWNGRVNNSGNQCTEGTYFYFFTIVGQDNVEIKQHGFVHLVRD